MKKLLFSLIAIMAFVACTDSGSDDGGGNSNNEKPKVPEITLDETAVNFTTDGGSTVVTFTSSDAWTAEAINNRADAWCSVSPTGGSAGNSQVTITTTANDTTDDRTATVVIKSGTIQKTIAVSQKQKDALTVTSSKFEVSADGGEITIEVKANIDFEYAIDDTAKEWITYQTTRAMKTSTLVFKVAENDDLEKREGKIAIKSGEFNEVITIYQAGAEPSIVISQNEYTVPSAGETIAVEVKSNVDVTVEMPKDAGWITENTTRATSTNTYYFDIETNNEYDARTAKIKFVNNENNLTETVIITQTQKDAIVIANDVYNVDSEGGEIEIEVGHNVDFDVVIADSWITQKSTRAFETDKLVFVVEKNENSDSRESTITFKSKDETLIQAVSIEQRGQSPCTIAFTISSLSEEEVHHMVAKSFGGNAEKITKEDGWYVITLKNDYKAVPDDAFESCKLIKVIIGDGITTIGGGAFSGCSSLTSVTIPDSVTEIGRAAFYECSSLTSVTIPDSVTEIGRDTFYHCI